MEFEQILQLIEKIDAAGVSSFEYENNGQKMSVKWDRAKKETVYSAAPEPEKVSVLEKEAETGNLVTSPLVGTFYAAPSQDSQPFVKKGDTVKKGQVLAIVEAMKLMNEIESEFEGIVAEVLVENGQAVEYGTPLFRIEEA